MLLIIIVHIQHTHTHINTVFFDTQQKMALKLNDNDRSRNQLLIFKIRPSRVQFTYRQSNVHSSFQFPSNCIFRTRRCWRPLLRLHHCLLVSQGAKHVVRLHLNEKHGSFQWQPRGCHLAFHIHFYRFCWWSGTDTVAVQFLDLSSRSLHLILPKPAKNKSGSQNEFRGNLRLELVLEQ